MTAGGFMSHYPFAGKQSTEPFQHVACAKDAVACVCEAVLSQHLFS